MAGSTLPTKIPPQTVPLTVRNPAGEQIADTNWYLFLYNLWLNVLASQGNVPLPPSVNIALSEVDTVGSDIPGAYREALNAALMQPEADAGNYATLRDLANVMALLDNDLPAQDAMALKGIQRNVIIITAGNTSASSTLSPAVDTNKTELRFLGLQTDAATLTNAEVYVQLVNSTTVTAFRVGSANTVAVSWETTEYK